MRLKKRLLALLMTGAMTAGLLAGCGAAPGNAENPSESDASQGQSQDGAPDASADKTYTIGICQLVQHEALDAATKGFQDRLTEKLGDKVKFDLQNAQNDTPTCATIANGFISSGVDLIMGNGTAALQAAAAGTDTIPILGTSITDYGTALDVSEWAGTSGRNISGTSDLAPLEEQANMLHELFPNAKHIGLLYCSGEPNSKYQVDTIRGFLEALGYDCTDYSFVDSNDLASIVTTACANSDVIYIPTDNSAASNTEIIKNVCLPAKIPVIAGEQGICAGCGVATLSIDYYELGLTTGDMAYEILVNGKDPSTMQVQFAPNVVKKYNAEMCEALGITPPDGYEAIES